LQTRRKIVEWEERQENEGLAHAVHHVVAVAIWSFVDECQVREHGTSGLVGVEKYGDIFAPVPRVPIYELLASTLKTLQGINCKMGIRKVQTYGHFEQLQLSWRL
jgi:hypothetical protein